jgi:hypothetical protein
MATWFSIFSSAVEGRVLDEGAGAMRPNLRGIHVGAQESVTPPPSRAQALDLCGLRGELSAAPPHSEEK